MKTTRNGSTLRTLTAVALAAFGLTACGGDDDDAGSIDTIDQWCATVKDIDARFDATDTSGASFEEKQVAYKEINGLLHDVEDSIELVDAGAREAVVGQVRWAILFTEILVEADSEEAAAEEMFGEGGLIAGEEELDEKGAEWILQNCGVDIGGES